MAFGHDASEERAWTEVERRRDLPDFVESELLASEGGDAPDLYDHLRSHPYDLIVFVGYHTPVAYCGVRALGDDQRVVLVPAGRDDGSAWLRLHDDLFERAEGFLVCTESERQWLAQRVGAEKAGRIENVGFVIGVNSLGQKTEPPEFDDKSYVIVAGDWNGSRSASRLQRWAEYLQEEVDPDLRLRLVGPGAERLRYGLNRTAGRLDICRWVSRALALLDPLPDRIIGREVLEAYNYGTPVIVSAAGGATREHAEDGNGGLWYRTDDEFFGAVEALLDRELRTALGQQGRAYAEETFGDADTYIKRLNSVLFP